MLLEVNQLDLFSDVERLATSRYIPNELVMSADTLVKWKERIFQYQQRTKASQSVQQSTLFDLAQAHCDPDSIDPFTLRLHSSEFYRMPDQGEATACLYFIIDNIFPILLYVGETKRTPTQRWKNIHDAKQYIMNYISLHRQYGLDVAVVTAFWWDAPMQTRPRQQLELSLIKRWRSPFNKENWTLWGRPFG